MKCLVNLVVTGQALINKSSDNSIQYFSTYQKGPYFTETKLQRRTVCERIALIHTWCTTVCTERLSIPMAGLLTNYPRFLNSTNMRKSMGNIVLIPIDMKQSSVGKLFSTSRNSILQ